MRGEAFFNGKEGFCPLEGEPKGSKKLLRIFSKGIVHCLEKFRVSQLRCQEMAERNQLSSLATILHLISFL